MKRESNRAEQFAIVEATKSSDENFGPQGQKFQSKGEAQELSRKGERGANVVYENVMAVRSPTVILAAPKKFPVAGAPVVEVVRMEGAVGRLRPEGWNVSERHNWCKALRIGS